MTVLKAAYSDASYKAYEILKYSLNILLTFCLQKDYVPNILSFLDHIFFSNPH